MRTHAEEARPARSLADIFAESLELLRQDGGEYGLIALTGGLAASIFAIVLTTIGGVIASALIAPVAGLAALLVLATTVAAVQRVENHLEPEAGPSFAATLVRAPWVIGPMVPALVVAGLGIGAAVFASEWTGRWLATAIGAGAVVTASRMSYAKTMRIPALFVRDISLGETALLGARVHAQAPAALILTWAITLAPWMLIALAGVLSGFGLLATVAGTFVFVVSMPIAGAMLSIIFATAVTREVLATPVPMASRAGGRTTGAGVTERLGRHVR